MGKGITEGRIQSYGKAEYAFWKTLVVADEGVRSSRGLSGTVGRMTL